MTTVNEPTEPSFRGRMLLGIREAVVQRWGESGLRAVAARLPPDIREATAGQVIFPASFFPIRHLVAWYEAVLAQVGGDEVEFRSFVSLHTQLGFGQVRKLLLDMGSLNLLVAEIPKLWRHSITHGQMSAVLAGQSLTFRLADFPAASSPVLQVALSEMMRQVVALTGREQASLAHAALGHEGLKIHVVWPAA